MEEENISFNSGRTVITKDSLIERQSSLYSRKDEFLHKVKLHGLSTNTENPFSIYSLANSSTFIALRTEEINKHNKSQSNDILKSSTLQGVTSVKSFSSDLKDRGKYPTLITLPNNKKLLFYPQDPNLRSDRDNNHTTKSGWYLVSYSNSAIDRYSDKLNNNGSISSRSRDSNDILLERQYRATGEDYSTSPALVLEPVFQGDHGFYRCRLDYWESPTTVSNIALFVAGKKNRGITYLTCRRIINFFIILKFNAYHHVLTISLSISSHIALFVTGK